MKKIILSLFFLLPMTISASETNSSSGRRPAAHQEQSQSNNGNIVPTRNPWLTDGIDEWLIEQRMVLRQQQANQHIETLLDQDLSKDLLDEVK